MNERENERRAEEPNTNTDEGCPGEALREPVRGRKDECVPVEKGEEDYIDDGEVQRDEHDDRFLGRKQEGAPERAGQPLRESVAADLE